ncbi:unnamed protein product, partial [Angiostrongylus costaricensis]|uniref:Thioredoxin domain-containing protein n=1 Tax=Angiostrongylus costaricensis TaxID=334426 RepID=A0A0R3PCQ9_ANGCS
EYPISHKWGKRSETSTYVKDQKYIYWVEWDSAVDVAMDLKKPIFLLIHKTWCGACKALKQEFNSSPKMSDLIALSKKFVMVNVQDDDEPEDEKYAPDGGYIPRILFLDSDGEPLRTNNEARYKNNKYFYPLIPQVVDGMERALMEFEEITKGNEDEENEDEGKQTFKQEVNEEDIHLKKENVDEKRERETQVKGKKESGKGMEKDENIAGNARKKDGDNEKEDREKEMKEDTKGEKKQREKDYKVSVSIHL